MSTATTITATLTVYTADPPHDHERIEAAVQRLEAERASEGHDSEWLLGRIRAIDGVMRAELLASRFA